MAPNRFFVIHGSLPGGHWHARSSLCLHYSVSTPAYRPLPFTWLQTIRLSLTFYFHFHQVILGGTKSPTIFDTKRKGSQIGREHAKILPKKRSLKMQQEKGGGGGGWGGGTGVGRGLNSGPGDAAASSTGSDPGRQLSSPRPGARWQHRGRRVAPEPRFRPCAVPSPLPVPRPLLLRLPLCPLAEPRARRRLPAAENRQPASAAPWIPGTVRVQVEAGAGPGSGALGSAAGSRREGPSAATWDARESREGLAPAGSLCPPRPPGCSGRGVGVKGKVREPAETVRERQGRGMQGHGKRPVRMSHSSAVCSLEGRVAASTEQ